MSHVYHGTFFILFGTLWEDVLCSCADAVSVKIMGLEKSGPELLLRHAMRHIFTVFLLHCKYSASWCEWVRLNLKKNNNTEVAFVQCAVTSYCKEDFLLFTCRISSEDGFNNVSCEIISQTVAAVCLRPNICLRSIKYVLTFMEILPTGLWVFQFYIFYRNKVKKKQKKTWCTH